MNAARLRWVISGLNFDKLTDWEEKRVEEWEKQFKEKGYLTDRQEEILERLFVEKSK